MGEMTPMRVEHALDPETAELLRELVATFAPPSVTNLDMLTPYDLGLEPWAFHDPQQKVDVVAYLDQQNQVRHVPMSRASEVPKAWRRMWLESRE